MLEYEHNIAPEVLKATDTDRPNEPKLRNISKINNMFEYQYKLIFVL